MTIDKEKLKALAEAAIKQHQEWVAAGEPWPVWNSYLMELYGAANPATILALLAEIEQLQAQVRLAGVAGELAVHEAVGRAATDFGAVVVERDQLKAENDALRNLKLPHYLKLSDDMRAAGEHAEQRAREDQCYSAPVLRGVFFEAAIQRWLDDQEEAIDAAMAKEASHE
ncbi:hypothetical protein [Pseudomonas putida]|uniref:Ead/Ea22-like family protein n=1 Tax=Pseudomonas putida TaxID=303 RepID=A0A1X0ZMC9_PSEPU|nr:hypothetical protein [Pseudomonas putida]ORL58092.1 hypothetical protein B7H17_26205 [Pseudomonas putida]